MSRERPERRPSPPLDAAGLDRLAIGYVGRYGTTEAKLAHYLRRKLRERGWEGEGTAPVEAVVAQCARLGYVDDAAFARARGEALTRRGLGARRVAQALQAAGVKAETAAPTQAAAEEAAWEAALAFARRKRLGAFATRVRDEDQQRRDLASMVRAGHGFTLARRIVSAEPGSDPSESVTNER
jgi:regulatory protein